MRIVLAVFVWVALIGGLATYMQAREHVKPAVKHEFRHATDRYDLEITTTFSMEPDPFALRTDDAAPPALVVKLNGMEVLRRTDRVESGDPIRLENLPGVMQGTNEVYLEANPPLEKQSGSYAVRVRLFRDQETLLDRSLWSEPGGRISSAVPVTVEAPKGPEEHTHGK
jgi:hypothetical protein